MKKLIASAGAAAVLAPAAFADVSLYGSIRYEMDYSHYSANAAGAGSNNRFTTSDGHSRIGIRGSDKWDDGDISTIWQVESALARGSDASGNRRFGTDTPFGTRNTFIGLQSNSLGTLRLGHYDSAYKSMLGASNLSSLFDSFDMDYKAGGRGMFSQAGKRLNNSINYDSPVWSGFQARATYGADANAGFGKGAPIAAATGLYTNGGFVVGLAGEYAANRNFKQSTSIKGGDTTPGASVTAIQLAGGYKFDSSAQLGAGWERIEENAGDALSNQKNNWNNFVVIGRYNLNPKLQAQGFYAWTRNYLGVSGQNGQHATVGLTYAVSKRTYLYTYATRLNNDAAQGGASFINGNGSMIATPGQTVAQLSMGIHSDF
ncbi:porin [Andreprevotia chitinilytica]|uniref:porin n=1 Tax=Andreprevotia chitinilytica TaxID=396808 RepID=UPI00055108E6|nr:porin [Andreprevotia chitinilytica]